MQKVWDVAPTSLLSFSNCFKITYKIVLASINCCRDCIQILTHFLNTPAQKADRRFHCRIHTTHCLGDRPYASQGQTSRQDYYFANKYLFFVRIQSLVGVRSIPWWEKICTGILCTIKQKTSFNWSQQKHNATRGWIESLPNNEQKINTYLRNNKFVSLFALNKHKVDARNGAENECIRENSSLLLALERPKSS